MKKHRLVIFSGKGDSTVCEWEVEDDVSVKSAEAAFNKARDAGWGAVKESPAGGLAIGTFDPELENIYLLKPIAGG